MVIAQIQVPQDPWVQMDQPVRMDLEDLQETEDQKVTKATLVKWEIQDLLDFRVIQDQQETQDPPDLLDIQVPKDPTEHPQILEQQDPLAWQD
jgi:hypothetical protein